MKPKLMIIISLLAAAVSSCVMQQETVTRQPAPQPISANYQVFYDELSPYGEWVDHPAYGYVWVPDAEPGFSPYATAGHWLLTEDGWTWVSDYRWGWAPFHYGRWDYDNRAGWFWVPDNQWGPAWVSWRSSPGYYGWAPLRPGISINVALGREYHERDERWIFVRDVDIATPDISHRYIDRTHNVVIIHNSVVIMNMRKDSRRNGSYIAGPDRDDVQRTTNRPVIPVVIRDDSRPGHRLTNGELQIFRPRIQNTGGNGRGPVPPNVIKFNDVRPQSERIPGIRHRDVDPPVNGNTNQPPTPSDPAPTNPGRHDRPGRPTVVPPSDRGRADQPGKPAVTTPPENPRNNQQPKPMDVVPPGTAPNPQPKPSEIIPPTRSRRDQHSRPDGVNPSPRGRREQPHKQPDAAVTGTKGQEKPTPTAAPSRRTRDPQPAQETPDSQEKEKRKRDQ